MRGFSLGCPTQYTGCYCSQNDNCFADAGGHNGDGPCGSLLEHAAQSTEPNYIGNHLYDPLLPAGRADLLTQCLADSECDSCFPPKNRCPTIEATSANPQSAAIGQPIALSVVASDPDNGPKPLWYDWIRGYGGPNDIGLISELFAPQVTLICGLASTQRW